jgi:hypothetical protein
MINKDQLVQGPFGSDACYESTIEQNGENITTWLCFGSGFTSSTLMTEGSKAVSDLLETAPELYKDLLHVDKDKKVWVPATITLPGKGMVFLDGSNTEQWNWSAVRAVRLTEEDVKSGKYPEGHEFKMDMQNKKIYGKNDFMDALEFIGFFDLELPKA